MKSAAWLVAGLFAMVLQGCTSTQKQFGASPEGVDAAMQAFVDQQKLSGAVMLVADDHQILHLSAVGQRDIERHLPMRTDTIFWVASMTKLMTSSGIMMLSDEGKLSIDDPVSKYIPAFAALKTPSGKPANLTLRHLLTHTSGLADVPKDKIHEPRNLAETMPYFLNLPMHFEPGTRWEYCQSGINTLGRIIEIVSGESYPDFMHERLFAPLGMKEATFYPTPDQISRLALPYLYKDGRLELTTIKLLPGPVGDRNHYPAANGGLFCTAEDYCRFAQMLLNHGSLDGKQYLRSETVKRMTSIQTDDIPSVGFIPGSAWGLAVSIVSKPTGITEMLSPGTFGHGGAYGTQVWIDPTKNRIYLMLIQRADLPNSDASEFRAAFQEAVAGNPGI
ncbi:MAG TPA: serine hydrolase domain-containing protein [Tepidisphaeraceae bacterium]|jgi:CubicO group peptidase (beta-lactamase class C family)